VQVVVAAQAPEIYPVKYVSAARLRVRGNTKLRRSGMKNKNAIKENMHALLECLFVLYANELRMKYPGQTIRNAAVFRSGVPEFARLGFIRLVDARKGIPEGIRENVVRTVRRAKHQPIWIPGPKFPNNPMEIYDLMKASMRGNEVVWQHFRADRRPTLRDRTREETLKFFAA
jgi:hypothetical protein